MYSDSNSESKWVEYSVVRTPIPRLGDKGIDWISEEFEDHLYQPSLGKLSKDGLIPPTAKFPKEKRKTLLAFGFLVTGLVINAISLALVHDRVPDRDKHPPLPDAILDSIPHMAELMKVPDVLVLVMIVMSAIVVLLHEHRWIVARRGFFILFVIYLMRSFTMYLTVLPVANNTVYCSPKENETTAYVVFTRVTQLLGGGGMQISGQKSICGDYIYSGHTAILTIGCLLIQEYTPKRLSILSWISFILSAAGVAILLIARGHYSIDVVIGYYAATRMFWAYHSLANNRALKIKSPTNFHSRVWWFPIFQFLEGNVDGPLPREHSLPLPLPWRSTIST